MFSYIGELVVNVRNQKIMTDKKLIVDFSVHAVNNFYENFRAIKTRSLCLLRSEM